MSHFKQKLPWFQSFFFFPILICKSSNLKELLSDKNKRTARVLVQEARQVGQISASLFEKEVHVLGVQYIQVDVGV